MRGTHVLAAAIIVDMIGCAAAFSNCGITAAQQARSCAVTSKNELLSRRATVEGFGDGRYLSDKCSGGGYASGKFFMRLDANERSEKSRMMFTERSQVAEKDSMQRRDLGRAILFWAAASTHLIPWAVNAQEVCFACDHMPFSCPKDRKRTRGKISS